MQRKLKKGKPSGVDSPSQDMPAIGPASGAEAMFRKGLEHHRNGRLQEAEAIYRQVLNCAPDHPDALHLLGVIAFQVGQNDIAVDLINRAILLNPQAPAYYSHLGNVFRACREPEKALACYQKALILKPDFADAHYNLGILHADAGRPEAAAACYTKAISLRPAYPEAYNNLGILHADAGRPEEAEECYREAIKYHPTFVEACNNLGHALNVMERPEESMACLKKAIELDPGNAEAYVNLSYALKLSGDFQEAIACLKKVVALAPGLIGKVYSISIDILFMLCQQGQCMQEIDKASLNELIPEDRRNWFWVLKAIILWLRGNINPIRQYLDASSSIHQQKGCTKSDKSQQAYHVLLSKLSAFYHCHPQLYSTDSLPEAYVVGDSHSLSFTHLTAIFGNAPYKVATRLIIGVKAYHLSLPENNQYKLSLSKVIESLPENSIMIAAIGEIDCRFDEGIYHAWKTGCRDVPIEKIVDDTVSGYVDFICKARKGKALKIFFYGVPAPLEKRFEHLGADEIQRYGCVPRLFNERLRHHALRAGCGFIDIYQVTNDRNGFSSGKYHIDGYHLFPFALHAAMGHTRIK